MLRHTPARKNKINLEDYNYRRDIENRLLMSDFSVFDVEVLEEILHSSLTLQVSNLAATLDADAAQVTESVDKLSQTGLLKRTGEMVKVDKEMRKYYEFQILKFDDKFRPDMTFLQSVLKKMPIHVLPNWYSIPRTSTNIFESIVERYLLTPKIFQRYLLELNLDDPVLQQIVDEVFASPELKVRSKHLREKIGIERDKFEEYMLLLEFNFICCLSYNRIGDEWKEVVTPFNEWREYLIFMRDSKPEPISESVDEPYPEELAFAKRVRSFCEQLKDGPVDASDPATIKMSMLGMARLEGDTLQLDEAASEWMLLSDEDLALAIYRHPENRVLSEPIEPSLDTERNLREIEKALSRVSNSDWIDYDQFLKGMAVPLGDSSGPTLSKQGRRWSYAIPQYTAEETTFIHAALFERLFEAGFLSIGTYSGGECFRVTDFGRAMLSLP